MRYDGPEAPVDLSFAGAPEKEFPALPSASLPPTLALDPSSQGEDGGDFSIGGIFGILRAKGADKTSFYAGGSARVVLSDFLFVQLSGSYHRTSYENETLTAYQYPVKLSAYLYPFPYWEVKPYIMGGGGWYYTTVEYRFPLNLQFNDVRKSAFGGHAGAGVELRHNSASINLEFQYDLINMTANGLNARGFNYWEGLIGLNLFF